MINVNAIKAEIVGLLKEIRDELRLQSQHAIDREKKIDEAMRFQMEFANEARERQKEFDNLGKMLGLPAGEEN